MEREADVVLDTDTMVPAACQGIVGVTVRADDVELRELLSLIEDHESAIASAAERALLAELDGSCRTPIGGHACLQPDGRIELTGLVARADGSFLLKRRLCGAATDAARLGRELAESLRRDAPADVFG
jgi:hydroxymethylbilane synthase